MAGYHPIPVTRSTDHTLFTFSYRRVLITLITLPSSSRKSKLVSLSNEFCQESKGGKMWRPEALNDTKCPEMQDRVGLNLTQC